MPKKLTDTVEYSIRSMLYNDELSVGDNLSDSVLSRRLGVSRTPVRNAIQKLAHEGLVEYKAGIGYFVRCPLRTEIEEIYELRELLECYAAGKAAVNADKSTIGHLEKICANELQILKDMRHAADRTRDSQYGKAFLRSDMDFHRLVVEAMGSRRILKTVGELSLVATSLGHVWKDVESDYWKANIHSYKFHCRILRAIKRRDSLVTKHVMREHLLMGKRLALHIYDQRHAKNFKKLKNTTNYVSKAERVHKDNTVSAWDLQIQIIQ